ncbi:uncharacterized protein [Dermacentor albipictus]|uniref:uncharacterized protein n=1 Tax=Dermacentor albipictus TaxID=60249 RepID=UPI0038FD27E8
MDQPANGDWTDQRNGTALPSKVCGFLVPLIYPEQTTRATIRDPSDCERGPWLPGIPWPIPGTRMPRRLPETRCVLPTSGNARDEIVRLHGTADAEVQTDKSTRRSEARPTSTDAFARTT